MILHRAVLAAACGVLALAGCSSDPDEPESTGASPSSATSEASPSTSAVAEAEPALELTTGTIREHDCVEPADRILDLAWFDVMWRAHEDLDSFHFRLVDSDGAKAIGPGFTVPPVNFGGRIDYSGALRWDGWRRGINDRMLSTIQMGSVVFWSPIEDETGLLVLHLRFDPRALRADGVHIGGVEATYRTADGETGTASVDTDLRWVERDRC
ncbi:hypothetical protein [Nocardioides mangrovi]|uniref:Lipoprotein n=1 Tax=Nocardioides mangrovi TaxID=2874580 RepID=A0ABS7UK14_9ACTN|nr:hypothetical protein [Nocardioides mangrovi]MBZ5741370.1 hypothetical protein [Nocardioides mangrovi]